MEIKYKKTITDQEVLNRIKKIGYKSIYELKSLEIKKKKCSNKKIEIN